ncbi:MAG: S16 family serine protease [Candidatus Micrarchaeota archaeon]
MAMERSRILLTIILIAFAISFNLGYNALPSPQHIKFQAPAIMDNGKGNLVEFEMFVTRGEGRTLVNIENAAFKEDVENALRKAKFNAYEYLGIRAGGFDLTLEVKSDGSDVSGESAGGMFAVAIIALHSGRRLREDVAISATISEDGTLSDVGGIEEKILAAKDAKRNMFLVSANQRIKDEEEIGKGISIARVKDLADAVKYLIE